jgi:hypothetical protein
MILDSINDEDCLGQLTQIARELAPTTLVREVARRLGSREAVIRWFQSLPQADDNGAEKVRFIQCDVPQRTRLLPDDPNCVERSLGALMLLESVDPKTPRALATVDRPMRHTGLVEKHGGRWRAVDLFARRNFSWSEFGKDVLQGLHRYVGKPVMSFYGMGAVADTVGELQDKAIGRDKPKQPAPPPGAQSKQQQRQPRPQPPRGQPTRPRPQQGAKADGFDYRRFVAGAGAQIKQQIPIAGEGGKGHGEKGKGHAPGAAPGDGAAGKAEAAERDGRDPHDPGAQPQRGWWFLVR